MHAAHQPNDSIPTVHLDILNRAGPIKHVMNHKYNGLFSLQANASHMCPKMYIMCSESPIPIWDHAHVYTPTFLFSSWVDPAPFVASHSKL